MPFDWSVLPATEQFSSGVAVTANGAFFGSSPAMVAISAILDRVGTADVPVLIQGETGSGKEVVARELHANSLRKGKPFIKLNCAALPSELVESELFGYERGAFTGAFQRKPGIFEEANGGTIFLDEIGDMDVRLQAKLLQVLQDYQFQRIGGKDTIKVDVRVIAATHQDLEARIEEGSFREDLYYRLNVVGLVMPPLRERKADLFPLAQLLLRKHAGSAPAPAITDDLRSAMASWDWPGNVRELENFCRRLLIFGDCRLLIRELLEKGARRQETAPAVIDQPSFKLEPDNMAPGAVLLLGDVTKANQRAEAEAIRAALVSTRWNRKKAAMILQVDYKALLYKMKKLGLDKRGQDVAVGGSEAEISNSAEMAEVA